MTSFKSLRECGVKKSYFVLLSVALASLLSACEPASEPAAEQQLETTMQQLDRQLLPNDEWQLSAAVIELSFCRNPVNEALLASEMELNNWRLTGDVTAFPPYRKDGLAALQEILANESFMLWQTDGSVSAQRYRIVMPAELSRGDVAEQVFPAVATLAAQRVICHTAVVEQ